MDESGDAAGKGGGRSKPNRARASDRLGGVRVEFRFSSFCAVQVPVVSDRLLITIISVDSGKTIAKSSKAAAINGTCQWHDSILQTIRFSKDEASQEFQEYQCKIVVSMGSMRAAILGEVYLNLTNYLSSSDSTAISLPLKMCNSGTVLQLQIQCLGVKSKSSGKSWKELSSRIKDDDEMDTNPGGFESILDKCARALSENHVAADGEDESGNRDAGDRKNLSPRENSNEKLDMGKQDSLNHGDNPFKDQLDTAEEKIEELRNQAKVWERHCRKLKIELKTLKNEYAGKSKQQAELARELSASLTEQECLRQQIEELKSSLEEVTTRQTVVGTPKSGGVLVLQQETINDMQFLIESNEHLTAQLNKTQEANIELVSILQELEETMELQRVEMSKNSQASDVVDHEVSKSELTVQEAAEWARILSLKEDEITMLREKLNRVLKMENADGAVPDDIYLGLEKENDFLKVKIQELENEFSELTEENLGLICKLKEVSGVAKEEDPCISNSEEMANVGRSTYEIEHLERKCADLELNLLNSRSEFSGLEEKFQKSQEELKERTLELSELREKLSHPSELEGADTGREMANVGRSTHEIEHLERKCADLELNLLNFRSEFSGLEEKFQKSQEELKERTLELSELREKLSHPTELEGADTGREMANVGRSTYEIEHLERKCADLELNLLNFRSEFSGLEEKFQKSQEELKERTLELSELREKLSHPTELEGDTGGLRHYRPGSGEHDDTETDLDVLKRTVQLKEQEIDGLQHCTREMENTIADIQKEKSQLEERLAASLEESSMTSKCLDEAREDLLALNSSVDSHVSANKVLETKISELVHTVMLKEQEIDGLQHCTTEMKNTISEIQKEKDRLEESLGASLKESTMTLQCLDEVREDLLVLTSSVDSHVSANKVLETKIDELVHTVMLKEQEIDALQHRTTEMENTISDIQKEKDQLEERLASSLKESSMTSKCLDEVREDLLVLTSSVDSHASANKVLETKISELESRKVELELLVSKLELENIEFSEFISELEAQLTSLTSEEESTRIEMDYSIALIANLKDTVEQQQAEVEAQKLEMKQKHLESQIRLSEVQEDSEALRRSNAQLHATIDSVAEECSSLQTLAADLKKQNLELHDHCAQLEQKLDQSKRKTMDLFETAEFLEAKLSTLQKETTLKEQSLLSELENIFQEHKEHEERINRAHFLLNKIEHEKIGEVKNLEREVMSLTEQLSSTDGERESSALDSIHEVSILRADKAKLEANLEDVSAEMRHYQSQLEDLRTESTSKIKGLIDSLNASKHNEETLTTDVEHMRRLMEAARSNEENLRKISDELELKYKSSDYEKHQIMDEISGLKIQVNKMASIQDELFKLQSSLDQAKFEKGKLEELLQSLSEECEELKVQKAMLTDKVSCIQSALHDAHEENRSKSTQAKLVVNKGNDDADNGNGGTHVNEDPDIRSKLQVLETRLAEALEENKNYRAQLQSPTGEGQSGSRDEKKNKDENRVAQLESELKDMQDRLLNVSMQYAEVEAQREELVMELKSATAKKGRWF